MRSKSTMQSVPPGLSARWIEPSVARVPDHRIVWLKGAKHWVLAERPAETTEATHMAPSPAIE
jgi:hypothetical protein